MSLNSDYYNGKQPEGLRDTYVYGYEDDGRYYKLHMIRNDEIYQAELQAYRTQRLLNTLAVSVDEAKDINRKILNKDITRPYKMNVMKSFNFFLQAYELFIRYRKEKKPDDDLDIKPFITYGPMSEFENGELASVIRAGRIDGNGELRINPKVRPLYIIFLVMHELGHLVLKHGKPDNKVNFDEKNEFLASYFARSLLCHFNMFLTALVTNGFCFAQTASMFNVVIKQAILRYLDLTSNNAGLVSLREDLTAKEIICKKELPDREKTVGDSAKIIQFFKHNNNGYPYVQGFFSDIDDIETNGMDFFFKAYRDEDPWGRPSYLVFYVECNDEHDKVSLAC